MHEVVGYSLLLIISIAILSACVMMGSVYSRAAFEAVLFNKAERIASRVTETILTYYRCVDRGGAATVFLDLPSTICGREYHIYLDNDTRMLILEVQNSRVVVRKPLDLKAMLLGEIWSHELAYARAVLRMNESVIWLGVG